MGLFDFIHTVKAARKSVGASEILRKHFSVAIPEETITEKIMFFSDEGILSDMTAFDIAIYVAVDDHSCLYEGSDEQRTRYAVLWLTSSRIAQVKNIVHADVVEHLKGCVKIVFKLQSDDLVQMIAELQRRQSIR